VFSNRCRSVLPHARRPKPRQREFDRPLPREPNRSLLTATARAVEGDVGAEIVRDSAASALLDLLSLSFLPPTLRCRYYLLSLLPECVSPL